MSEILIIIGIVLMALPYIILSRSKKKKPKIKKMTEEEIKNWKCPWNICG